MNRIVAAVERNGGNQAKAARELGLARSTVSVAMTRHRLESFQDWGRRWIAAADARAGIRVVPGETPPWHTVTTARTLNDELRQLIAATPERPADEVDS